MGMSTGFNDQRVFWMSNCDEIMTQKNDLKMCWSDFEDKAVVWVTAL